MSPDGKLAFLLPPAQRQSQLGQIKLINKNVDRTDRIILGQIVIQSFRKQRALTAVIPNDKAHHRILRQSLGAAVTWPLGALARQTMPVIGFLGSQSRDTFERVFPSFWRGLGELGFAEGKNVGIEYRWTEDRYDRLPAMAAELVLDKVAVIVASGTRHQCQNQTHIWQ